MTNSEERLSVVGDVTGIARCIAEWHAPWASGGLRYELDEQRGGLA